MKEKNEVSYKDSLQTVLNSYWQIISRYISKSWEEKTQEIAPGVTETSSGLKGFLTTKTYKINPNPSGERKQSNFAYDVGPLLNELDQQQNGRKPYSKFNTLTDDIHLLADTSPNGSKIRGLLLNYLKKLEHIDQITREVVSERTRTTTGQMKIIPEKFIRAILLKILMRVFFASDKLPENVDETMKLFATTAFNNSFSLYPQLSFFDSTHRKAKQQYKELCNEVMNNQVHLIFERFQSDTFDPELKGENLFIDLIMLKVNENYPSFSENKEALKHYLKNLDEQEIIHYLDFMTSFPSILILADNISAAIIGCIEKLRPTAKSAQSQLSMLQAIQEECATQFPNKAGIDLTRKELRELKALDIYYHTALNALVNNVIGRYTENPVKLKNKKTGQEVEIAANSILLFQLGSAAGKEGVNEKNSSNFSVQSHRRKCPGSQVAAVIFKAIAIEFLFGPKKIAFDSTNSCYLIDAVALPEQGKTDEEQHSKASLKF